MQTLPKAERLCARKQIAALMNEGTTLFHFPFKVFYAIKPAAGNHAPCCQMAVSVPKRNFKRAVKRNLLKRRTRESFRKNKAAFYGLLQHQHKTIVLFFHYVSPEILSYADIETSITCLFEQLGQAVAHPAVATATADN